MLLRILLGRPSLKVDELGRGAYIYVGKDAAVVLNKDGQVVTAWANSRSWMEKSVSNVLDAISAEHRRDRARIRES